MIPVQCSETDPKQMRRVVQLLAQQMGTGGGSTPTGPATGDLAGTYPGPTVATVGGQSAANVAGAVSNAVTAKAVTDVLRLRLWLGA
jgi:outer membrane lipoprotein SlyB